jgi:hypothetical protein
MPDIAEHRVLQYMVEQTTKIIAHANQYLTPSQWMPLSSIKYRRPVNLNRVPVLPSYQAQINLRLETLENNSPDQRHFIHIFPHINT